MSKKYIGGLVTSGAPAGYSVAFNGSTDYLTTTQSVYAQASDFTCEAWVYGSVGNAYQGIISTRSSVNNNGYAINLTNTGNLEYWINTVSYASTALPLNQWNHVAMVRSGTGTNNVSCYLNGTRVGQFTATGTTSNTNLIIGRYYYDGTNQYWLTGYVSNARLSSTAIYSGTSFATPTQLFNNANIQLLTCNSPAIIDQSNNAFTITTNGSAKVSNFTPFTANEVFYNAPSNGVINTMVPSNAAGFNPAYGAAAPGVWTLDQAEYLTANRLWPIYDPQFNNTTLMLHGNSPNNLPTWITDASTNNFALTVNGSAKASSQTPFSISSYPTSGSGYFNAGTDGLSLAANAALAMGTGDFTIEMWVNGPNANSTVGGSFPRLFTLGTIQGVGCIEAYNSSSTGLTVDISGAGGPITFTAATLLNSTWNHFAITRSGTSLKAFVNGTQAGSTATNSTNLNLASTTASWIGAANASAGAFTGYISNFRIVKGQALATGNFTSPTAPLTTTSVGWTGANAASSLTGTVSLLTVQNAQPSANSSFTDSSTNNFAITRNGSTTQGTFTPFSQTGWSNYFNGSTDYASVGTTLFNYTTANANTTTFTIEAMVYTTAYGSPSAVYYSESIIGKGDVYMNFGINGSGNLILTHYDGTQRTVTSSGTVPLNTWTYVACTVSSGVITLYINGISSGTGTWYGIAAAGQNSVSQVARVSTNASSIYFSGYLSNIRVSTNVRTITTPTVSYSSDANTALLICQSNRFVDNSSNALAITLTGTPSVQAFSPFYPKTAYDPLTIGGSGYFDGNSSYLTLPSGSAFAPGTGDFTVDGWFYPTTSGTGAQVIWSQGVSGTNFLVVTYEGANKVVFYGALSGGGTAISSTTNAAPFMWNYFSVRRVSGTVTVYVNGVAGTGTSNTTNLSTTTYAPAIGSYSFNNTYAFVGYISNLRFINGTGVVPSSVPTVQNTAITNTQALLNYTNAGIIDNTGKNDLVTVGSAQISTTQSKWGGSSMKFNGTTDYLVSSYGSATSPLEVFNAGDFTVECWVYFSANPTSQNVICSNYQTTTLGWTLSVESSVIKFRCLGDPVVVSSTTTIVASAWYHVAVSRNGSTIRAFLNGTQEGSATNSDNIATTTVQLNIGRLPNNSGFFNGYMDDLRITKYARYTANFTPPTSQLQDQ